MIVAYLQMLLFINVYLVVAKQVVGVFVESV